jgi:hypothetical protein
MSRYKKNKARVGIELLEGRDLPSVSSLWFSGNILVVKTDNAATSVAVNPSGSNIVIQEVGSGRSWSYAASQVGKVEFQGGAGNDRFVNNVYALPVNAYGFGGNDYLEGYNGADYFDGGDGNDHLVGYGGNDTMFGGTGADILLGMAGNDQLVGQDGNDRLNGREGNDYLWGGNGDDVLITIDNGTGDYVEGNAGRDIIWVDRISGPTDWVYGVEAGDKVQYVDYFANGADRTLNGDRIADPTVMPGHTYKAFYNNALFASTGPSITDIRQGNLGDCWVLAGLGAIAIDNPFALRQNVVDFDDGTYGVRLGNNFYRVDNDLPVATSSSTAPVYAALGLQNSMWVAVVEKAYAHYRTGANSYASIEGGWSVDVNRAFGATSTGDRGISSYSSAAALANEIFNRWNNYEAVTIGFAGGTIAAGAPLINYHMYTVYSVTRNSSGVVTSITLRNPWGYDGAGSDGNYWDGFVTVTPDQLYNSTGRVNWGRV